MIEKFNASIYSALVCSVAGYVFLQLNEYLFFQWSFASLFYELSGVTVYFLSGLIFSFVLLFGLEWSVHKLNRIYSCCLFLFVGFVVAGYLSYEAAWLSNHGQSPFMGKMGAQNTFAVFSFGIMGVSAALSAWIYLLKARK